MPDYLVILLTMLAALSLNIIVWVVNDMDMEDRKEKEIERGLNQGEKHDSNS